ncbi:SAM-dependent methyltransferase, partial [Parabacteroides merdae]|nr:SAM-dependent methyltransferase [Parabacteroides merdae]
ALSPAEAKEAARKTRGLTFPHIHKAVKTGSYPLLKDAFNTCDPRNGNWTERILPIETYRSLAKPFGYQVRIGKGFYNTDRSNPISTFICLGINGLIRISGKAGFLFAPFITLHLQSDNKGR